MPQHVHLPKGAWVDHWDTTRVVMGPAGLEEEAPLEKAPIFVREGADVLGTF